MQLYWWPETRSLRALRMLEEAGRADRCLERPALPRALAIDAAGV
jgi:hypothetical protein